MITSHEWDGFMSYKMVYHTLDVPRERMLKIGHVLECFFGSFAGVPIKLVCPDVAVISQTR